MKELRQRRDSRRFAKAAAVCAACVMFLVMSITGFAAKTGNVRVNDVNVRSEASAESNRVCKLPINTTVTIVDEATGNDGNVWYSVTFTLDGAEKAGWIRSDMLNVTESEGTEGEISTGGSGNAYTILEPIEPYEVSDALTQTTISVGEESVTAWQVSTEATGGQELYLVYAEKADGSNGWFYYDPAEETFQRDLGQFAGSGEEEPEGLIEALQKELTELKESSAKKLNMRLYLIVGLAVLCVILLVLAIVFGLKYRDAAYEYYEDDEEDGDEDAYDEDDDEEEEEDAYEEKPVKRRGLFRRRVEEEEEEEDDFESFFAAAKEKQEETEADDFEAEETEEETEELPEIDMSAILEIEEEAKKEQDEAAAVEEAQAEPVSESEEDGLDDFDIEILDWEDLGL